jgi:hypothetical protein
MPDLKIGDTVIHRVHSARVEILNEDSRGRLRGTPLLQFTLTLPLEHEDMIAKWALAPPGADRYKTVELALQDRSAGTKLRWAMKNCYVHRYEEVEFPCGVGSDTDQGNYVQLVLRGQHLGKTDYKKALILEVTRGSAESVA